MNDLEKKSFYSFLLLYLSSSFLFVSLSAYWYYSAQKSSLESETYYKLTHIADKLSGSIINAQMKGETLKLPNPEWYEFSLIPLADKTEYKSSYYEDGIYKVLISDAPQEHLGIAYVLVKTDLYFKQLSKLQKEVLFVAIVIFSLIVFISFLLAKLFMRPVHQRISQIENFIQDVTHELNTPITALGMSASRAIKKQVYDKKILTNISISTKQLETIYKSLTYLNFSDKQETLTEIDIALTLKQVIKYYQELNSAKRIAIQSDIEPYSYLISQSKAELLFSNLLSNAIKYSMPETTITVVLKEGYFSIEDEGVGIAQEKLTEIFKLYKRESNIAGGFGVGLSIVKQISDEFAIDVKVDSVLGEGSKFELLFARA